MENPHARQGEVVAMEDPCGHQMEVVEVEVLLYDHQEEEVVVELEAHHNHQGEEVVMEVEVLHALQGKVVTKDSRAC